MKLEKPIQIDFIDFIKTGRFDCLKIGQTKEHILSHFPHPENDPDSFVWQYGSIELHFSRNMLSYIFCDDLRLPLGNDDLIVDHWFFKNFNNGLLVIIETLTKHSIDYKLTHHKKLPYQCDIEIIDSAVRLGFVDHEEKGDNPHNFYLNHFSYSKLHTL